MSFVNNTSLVLCKSNEFFVLILCIRFFDIYILTERTLFNFRTKKLIFYKTLNILLFSLSLSHTYLLFYKFFLYPKKIRQSKSRHSISTFRYSQKYARNKCIETVSRVKIIAIATWPFYDNTVYILVFQSIWGLKLVKTDIKKFNMLKRF